jgi:hypothetical protein
LSAHVKIMLSGRWTADPEPQTSTEAAVVRDGVPVAVAADAGSAAMTGMHARPTPMSVVLSSGLNFGSLFIPALTAFLAVAGTGACWQRET